MLFAPPLAFLRSAGKAGAAAGRRAGVLAILLAAMAGLVTPTPAVAVEEPPALAAAVAGGQLPPLAERLPRTPRRDLPARSDWTSGRYGGRLSLLTRGGRDARDLFLLGYARLLVWDAALGLRPDLLAGVEVEEGRRFVLRLRPGHRWSDGAPFTAEDFRFWWEEVANHPALSPGGPPPELLVDGRPPRVAYPDALTVVYEWPRPNARFLPALAASRPLLIYRPAHHLHRFHADHADPAALAARAEAAGLSGWPALFEARDRLFHMDDPTLPTLQPWRGVTAPPTERWLGERNPYFHRVDAAGRQLPYLDEVAVLRSQPALIVARTAAGDSDLQAVGLTLADVSLLKTAEAEGVIAVRLWPIGRGAQLALHPNLNAADPAWRALLRARDFRRALSLAVDRDEIATVVFQGQSIGGNNLLLPGSPLADPARRAAWATHDPAAAAALLDGLGLAWGEDGRRRLPDGRPLELVAETGNVDPTEVDVLELLRTQLAPLGIDLLVRSSGRSALRRRIQSGATQLSLFYGLANGLATAEMSPAELAPTSDRHNHWPAWGRHFETVGRGGEAPDQPVARQLLDLYAAWSAAQSSEGKAAAWQEMLAIHADQVFTIGLAAGLPQPVVANPRLRNLPQAAPFLYEPGAYFGRFRPDTFWLAE